MGYLKFRADRLFDGYQFQPAGSVLITGSNGVIEAIVDETEAGDDIQQLPGIATPGLINCHCHLELSHLLGLIPENEGLIPFVLQVMRNRFQPDESIQAAIANADRQLWEEGIVAVGDICNTTHTLETKKTSRIQYINFIEATGVQPGLATERFEQCVEMMRAFEATGPSFIVPHAPYSVSKALFEKINILPGNRLLSIHNQEVAAENEWFRERRGDFTELFTALKIDTDSFSPGGRSSLQTFLPWINKDHQLILVHNVASSEADIRFAQEQMPNNQLSWCLCPNANHYISRLSPPVNALLQHKVQIVLGTDSLASNHALSIVSEINRLRQQHPDLSFATCLQWATSNGAAALGLDHLFGSFEHGKKPGLVLIDDRAQHLTVTKHIL